MHARTHEQIPGLVLAIGLSFLLHIGFFVYLLIAPPVNTTLASNVITVSIEPPQALREPTTKIARQIVHPTNNTEAPKIPTNLMSDHDSAAEKEQIKRGDAPEAAPIRAAVSKNASAPAQQKAPPANQPSKSAAKEKPSKAPPRIRELALDDSTLKDKFGIKPSDRPTLEEAGQGKSSKPLENYRPYARAAGSGAALLGVTGTTDFLPNLPDGDITFLNAKANRFAVFVRRVAEQVFGELRRTGWDTLTRGDVEQVSDFVTIKATLSPTGELIAAIMQSQSGSARFDTVVLHAVQKGANDRNPPQEAALPDGNFHFTFQARSWSRGAPSRHGGLSERRWLLLGTGLE
jgi:hypothetical protein